MSVHIKTSLIQFDFSSTITRSISPHVPVAPIPLSHSQCNKQCDNMFQNIGLNWIEWKTVLCKRIKSICRKVDAVKTKRGSPGSAPVNQNTSWTAIRRKTSFVIYFFLRSFIFVDPLIRIYNLYLFIEQFYLLCIINCWSRTHHTWYYIKLIAAYLISQVLIQLSICATEADVWFVAMPYWSLSRFAEKRHSARNSPGFVNDERVFFCCLHSRGQNFPIPSMHA